METMGLEPTTPCLQSRCSSQLSYVPGSCALIRCFTALPSSQGPIQRFYSNQRRRPLDTGLARGHLARNILEPHPLRERRAQPADGWTDLEDLRGRQFGATPRLTVAVA